MRTCNLTLLLLALVLLVPAASGETLLYDVDFRSPPHVVGLPPAVGTGPAPRLTPTAINFGDPLVVSGYAALPDQPCLFGNGTTGYDQIRFGVGPTYLEGFPEGYDCYRLTMEVTIGALAGDEFVISLDIPTIHYVRFVDAGGIRILPGGQLIGSYVPGALVRVEILLDTLNSQWTIWLDGALAHTGPVTFEDFNTVRWHLSGTLETNAAAADNFRLYGFNEASGLTGPEGAERIALRCVPNPSHTPVAFRWSGPVAAIAAIEILSADGRIVWQHRAAAGGPAELRWDGRDATGRTAPAGLYWVRLRDRGEDLAVQRLVLVR